MAHYEGKSDDNQALAGYPNMSPLLVVSLPRVDSILPCNGTWRFVRGQAQPDTGQPSRPTQNSNYS